MFLSKPQNGASPASWLRLAGGCVQEGLLARLSCSIPSAPLSPPKPHTLQQAGQGGCGAGREDQLQSLCSGSQPWTDWHRLPVAHSDELTVFSSFIHFLQVSRNSDFFKHRCK